MIGLASMLAGRERSGHLPASEPRTFPYNLQRDNVVHPQGRRVFGREALDQVSPVITRQTTMWKA